jgi:hypothetical protein
LVLALNMGKELTFYCVVCCRILQSRNYSSVARFEAFAAVFVLNAASRRPNRICTSCSLQLTNPYEIVLKDDTIVRAIHVTSRLLADVVPARQKPRGLLALDPIPCGAFLPYPGKLVDEINYANFKTEFGKELSHEWAKGGPKHLGARTLLLGQYARASRRSCAHFINCAKGLKKGGNCQWGMAKIDERFVSTYPDLEIELSPKENYPGIRVKTPLQPGDEFLITTYGSQFWSRMERESHGTLRVIRPVALNQAMAAVLEPKRGVKRAREEACISLPPPPLFS